MKWGVFPLRTSLSWHTSVRVEGANCVWGARDNLLELKPGVRPSICQLIFKLRIERDNAQPCLWLCRIQPTIWCRTLPFLTNLSRHPVFLIIPIMWNILILILAASNFYYIQQTQTVQKCMSMLLFNSKFCSNFVHIELPLLVAGGCCVALHWNVPVHNFVSSHYLNLQLTFLQRERK